MLTDTVDWYDKNNSNTRPKGTAASGFSQTARVQIQCDISGGVNGHLLLSSFHAYIGAHLLYSIWLNLE